MTLSGRLSDLRRARDESGEVFDVGHFYREIVELAVGLPHLAATAQPGQFAQLRSGEGGLPLLRRPMSVARVRGKVCSFVFESVGVGTHMLATMRPGQPLDVLGPLGNGFTIPAGVRRVLCVAGGLGCAPFPLLADRALAAGAAEVVVLNGAATATRLYPASRFAGGDPRVRVVEATDDGSRGHHGLVTELVAAEVATGVDAVYGCGPNPMLAALAAVLESLDRRPPITEVSLEAPMGCGFGTCLGCALPVRDGAGAAWALCCREGPVMDITRVDWEALRALPAADVA